MRPQGYDIEVKAALLRSQSEPMTVESIWLRNVGPSDVRVRIEVTGVCHSDLSLARGVIAQELPAVLGHEACGTVVEVGSEVKDLDVGQRVVLLWLSTCGVCFYCERGEGHLCVQGALRSKDPYAVDAEGNYIYPGLTVGSFAEQTVVPRNAVLPVPDDIDSADAALLGCAVTTGVGAVVKTAEVEPNSSVMIIGLGGVGMSAVQGARLAGASLIIAVDRSPAKAEQAKQAGAHHFFVAGDELKSSVRSLTDKRGVDYAFDCVGSAATIREAWSLSRRGGSTFVVGVGKKDDLVTFSALELFHFARSLTGCVAGSIDAKRDLTEFYDWLREGKLDLKQLVTGHGKLEDIESAFNRMSQGEGLRTLIRPNTGS